MSIRLAETLKTELTLPVEKTIFWSDSQTVIKWIKSTSSCRFKAFVAHRVGEILTSSEAHQWRYVPSELNPADDCSRGVNPAELDKDHRWFAGPSFLYENEDAWPSIPAALQATDEELSEVSQSWVGTVATEDSIVLTLLSNVSCLFKARLRLAFILRFIHNSRNTPKRVGPITTQELDEALRKFVVYTQQVGFEKEYHALSKGHAMSMSSALLKLSPFLDDVGVLRVGGRLTNSVLPFSSKHPILLPARSALTTLIVRYFHRATVHAKAETLLHYIRAKFWIVKARRAIQAITSRCVTCQQLQCKVLSPLMASLPSSRLQPYLPPFSNAGVDFFGPFTITIGRRREKRWICLFTCFATRAVHIEVAESLDTDAFLLCLRRFVSRRGVPNTIHSDNGTNFTSADRELKEGLRRLNQDKLSTELLQRGINWRFSPPSGPHHGGCWERLVKPFKLGLKAVFLDRSVPEPVLLTTLIEIEGILNSRPLTNVSSSPDEAEPLTPNHFLMGRPNPYIPADVVHEDDIVSRKRFKFCQALIQSFWKRWIRHYVPDLIERHKWFIMHPNLQVNDYVFIKDPSLTRGLWPAGRVVETYPGSDGIVRSVKVKTAHGEYVRPTVKLCKVDLSTNSA